VSTSGGVVGDENANRIEQLTQNYLTRIADSHDGWSTLYRDPNDGRYWEMTYPESGRHGGGPPTLKVVDLGELRTRFDIR
jgi:Immunity protein 27